MMILSRKAGEELIIPMGERIIRVVVVEVRPDKVRLGIEDNMPEVAVYEANASKHKEIKELISPPETLEKSLDQRRFSPIDATLDLLSIVVFKPVFYVVFSVCHCVYEALRRTRILATYKWMFKLLRRLYLKIGEPERIAENKRLAKIELQEERMRRSENYSLQGRYVCLRNSVKKKRCSWVGRDMPDYAYYHDREWGRPVHDDRELFEMLVLRGFCNGAKWISVFRNRESLRRAFRNFDVKKVAEMSDDELEIVFAEVQVGCNRSKVFSARSNAVVFHAIQKEFGSFNTYLWSFVGNRPIVNKPASFANVQRTSREARRLSKDLRKRGMKNVGPITLYSYMQAVGLVNDHLAECFKSRKNV